MKIYCSRSSESKESQIDKFLGKDLWIKVIRTWGLSREVKLAQFISIHTIEPTGDLVLSCKYIRYDLFKYIADGGDIDSDISSVISAAFKGYYIQNLAVDELIICKPIEVYTTEELKELFRYEQ